MMLRFTLHLMALFLLTTRAAAQSPVADGPVAGASRVPAGAPGPARCEGLAPLAHRLGVVGTAIFFTVHYGLF